jgi:hypothetical protein
VVGDRRYYAHNRADCEAVAEAAAHAISARFNHDITGHSAGYIASWVAGDVDRLTALQQRVGKVTATLLPPDRLDLALDAARQQAATRHQQPPERRRSRRDRPAATDEQLERFAAFLAKVTLEIERNLRHPELLLEVHADPHLGAVAAQPAARRFHGGPVHADIGRPHRAAQRHPRDRQRRHPHRPERWGALTMKLDASSGRWRPRASSGCTPPATTAPAPTRRSSRSRSNSGSPPPADRRTGRAALQAVATSAGRAPPRTAHREARG